MFYIYVNGSVSQADFDRDLAIALDGGISPADLTFEVDAEAFRAVKGLATFVKDPSPSRDFLGKFGPIPVRLSVCIEDFEAAELVKSL